MNPTQLKKLCKALIQYYNSGNYITNQWVQGKKDILNKWANGHILSPKQVEYLITTYNYEVLDTSNPIDVFATAVKKDHPPTQRISKQAPTPEAIETPWDDDLPF